MPVEVNWEVFAEDVGEFDELSSDDFDNEDEKVENEEKK
jgi:hypothetical protein